MSPLKALLQKLPYGRRLAERTSYLRRSRTLAQIGNAEDRFTHIFRENKWRDPESLSGAGSSKDATIDVRRELPQLLKSLGTRSLLDAPCGDFNWFAHMSLPDNIRYLGADIVAPLINNMQSRYATDERDFVQLDITAHALPEADLWLCRDCLIHLSFEDIGRAFSNFHSSTIRYWLVTTHRHVTRNIDIPTGHCRLVNLEIPPFNFPNPLRYIADNDAELTGKCLGLWEREQLIGRYSHAGH